MMIEADVKSGQCKICNQGGMNGVPVLDMTRTGGMNVWMLAVCKKCAAELRQHLDEFLHPKDD